MIEWLVGSVLSETPEDTECIVIPAPCNGDFSDGIACEMWCRGSRRNKKNQSEISRLYEGPMMDFRSAHVEEGNVHPIQFWGDGPPWILFAACQHSLDSEQNPETLDNLLQGIEDFCASQSIKRVSIPTLSSNSRKSAKAIAVKFGPSELSVRAFITDELMRELASKVKRHK